MKEEEKKDMDGKKDYRFDKIPNNIRQIGQQTGKTKYYIEDYVITYMEEILGNPAENTALILLGKPGWADASRIVFVYGGIKTKLEMEKGDRAFSEEEWDKLVKQSAQYFPEAQILGWACSIPMKSSRHESQIMQIHRRFFGENRPLCFLKTEGEKEENLHCWQNGALEKQTGYTVFYADNPQMQDYVLQGKPQISMEADYHDEVTKNVRSVIAQKNEEKSNRRILRYMAGIVLSGALLVAIYMLLEGKEKLRSLEDAVSTLAKVSYVEAETKAPVLEKTEKLTETKKTETKKTETKAPTATAVPEKIKSVKKEKKKKTKKTVSTAVPKPEGSYYKVAQGDTLSQIVWRQYRDMAYIEIVKKANGIEDGNQIKAGEKLLLPPRL